MELHLLFFFIDSFIAWLTEIHSTFATSSGHIKNEETTPTAWPRCLVDRALHCSTELAAQLHSAPQPYRSQPLRFTRDPPANQMDIQWYTITHDRQHFTSQQLYSLTTANTAGAGPVTYNKLNSAIVQQSIRQLYDYKTLIKVTICVVPWVSLQTTLQYPTIRIR